MQPPDGSRARRALTAELEAAGTAAEADPGKAVDTGRDSGPTPSE